MRNRSRVHAGLSLNPCPCCTQEWSQKSEACHAHASTSVFGQCTKKQEKPAAHPHSFAKKFPLGVSFNRNTLPLPSFNWCFYDLWVFREVKWEYPKPLLFIVRKSSWPERQKIRLQHVIKLLAHSANVTETQTNCFSFGISAQRWVARFPYTSNSQCISVNKWDLFIASLCLDPPLIL